MASETGGENLEGILLKRFTNFATEDDYHSGYMDGGEDKFLSLLDELRTMGYSFAIRHSIKREDKETARICYSNLRGECEISFFGSPFQITKCFSMECSLGPHYYKKSKESRNAEQKRLNQPPVKRRKRTVHTQRIGCPAKAFVKVIKIYLGYEMEDFRNTREKLDLMKNLKNDLENKDILIRTEERVYIQISTENAHTHPINTAVACLQLHPILQAKIKKLVDMDCRSVKAIKLHLQEFVQNMFANTTLPHHSNRCYYPTDKIIYNHMRRGMLESTKNRWKPEYTSTEDMTDVGDVGDIPDTVDTADVSDMTDVVEVTEVAEVAEVTVIAEDTDVSNVVYMTEIDRTRDVVREKLQTLMDMSYTFTDVNILEGLHHNLDRVINDLAASAQKPEETICIQEAVHNTAIPISMEEMAYLPNNKKMGKRYMVLKL